MPCFAYVGAEDNRKGIPFVKIVSLLCKLIQFLMVALSVTVHKALILLVFLNHPYQSLAFKRFSGTEKGHRNSIKITVVLWRRVRDLNPGDIIHALRDFESRLFDHLSNSPYHP